MFLKCCVQIFELELFGILRGRFLDFVENDYRRIFFRYIVQEFGFIMEFLYLDFEVEDY